MQSESESAVWGRKQPDVKTSRVILITLFNLENISDNITGMTPEFCLESGCLKKFLNGASGERDLGLVDPGMCCGPCSGINCIRATVASDSSLDVLDVS